MLKILQAKLQQYVNRELPDVRAGFRKVRGTRDQIANIRWIMEKARGPAPSLQGNSTPDAKAAMQLILQKHFEQFLTLLTGGLGR